MNLAVVILAAGKGTRMKSDLPKVLHPIAGRPMVQHVVDAAGALDPDNTVLIYGHGGDAVRQAVTGSRLQWAEQAEQLGTGHAVAQALPHLEEDVVLVLYGDVPLIQPQTLRDFVARVDDQSLALMTLTLDDPSGYGRVIRDGDGKVRRVVEQKDASDDEKAVREINTGILACTRRFLNDSLPRLSNSNAQGEYYLTDLIAMAVDAGMEVVTEQPGHAWEVDGVNDRVQLARLERVYQRVRAESLMRRRHPARSRPPGYPWKSAVRPGRHPRHQHRAGGRRGDRRPRHRGPELFDPQRPHRQRHPHRGELGGGRRGGR